MGKKQLHIVLIPAMAHGHTIPMVEMAKLFHSRGVKVTIISTPSFAAPIAQARDSGLDIGLEITPFPPHGSSLPPSIASFDQMSTPDLVSHFLPAMDLLREPVEDILRRRNPDCLISDVFLPWTADSAAAFKIPRLVFSGTSFFSWCLSEQMQTLKPFNDVSSDSESFLLAGLPHELRFVRSQISPFLLHPGDNEFSNLFKKVGESLKNTYGEVVNSFHELESEYADHYVNVLGRKAWSIGPLLLCSNGEEGEEKKKLQRGEASAIDEHECLTWLDSRRRRSVVYVCFGSVATFTPAQLRETAAGLEASNQDFIWVVRKKSKKIEEVEEEEEEEEEWLPPGFEERVKERGMIIRGWAPQVVILGHPAVGAFVTHCGWNSTLEGVCAGVPMVTWPVFAEQFFNEKLVTEVLRTGVPVGNKRWMRVGSEGVGREAVAEAVERVIAGEEAAEMRRRAEGYKEMAKKAVEEGGSSYDSLNALIEDLSKLCSS